MSGIPNYPDNLNNSLNSSYPDFFDDPNTCLDMDCIWVRERESRIYFLRPLTVLLSLIGILGIVGNVFVIIVVSRTFHKRTSTYLVLMLGIIDLIACSLVIPGTLYKEWLFEVQSDIVCKVSELMRIFVITSSAMTLTGIAFDRFWMVYKNTEQAGNLKITLVMILMIVITGISLGVPPMLGVGVYMESDDMNNLFNIKVCITNDILISENALLIYWKVITILFSLLILTVIIMYLSIFTMVYKHTNDTKGSYSSGKTVTSLFSNRQITPSCEPVAHISQRGHQKTFRSNIQNSSTITKIKGLFKGKRSKSKDNIVMINVISNSTTSTKTATEQNLNTNLLKPRGTPEPLSGPSSVPDSSSVNAHTTCPLDCQNSKHDTRKRLSTGQKSESNTQTEDPQGPRPKALPLRHLGAHIKTTKVLCIITAVYVAAFLPMFLITHKMVKQNVIVFYLYFINNAANPIIYSFMNRNFRFDIWKMFLCKRNRLRPS